MSRNDVILGIVCALLVGFSLVVSLVLPRSRPDFPGRRVGLFVLVAALLVLAMLVSVERLGAEEGGESEGAAPAESQSTPEETQSGPTETSGGATTGGASEGDPANGEKVFASAGCGGCHTMEAAGSGGTVGPNLDELKPSYDKVVSQVKNGGGAMPAFEGDLSAEEIQDVSAYVAESTQGR